MKKSPPLKVFSWIYISPDPNGGGPLKENTPNKKNT